MKPNDSGQNSNTPMIRRQQFFSEGYIKEIHISPRGDKSAYIAKNNEWRSIHVLPIVGQNAFANIINDENHIKKMRFVGNKYIVYVYSDENNNMKLISVNLETKERKDISPIDDAKSIHIANGKNAIMTISYNGRGYFLHKIDLLSGFTQLVKEDVAPIVAIFDNDLKLKLCYKNISGQTADVFINDGTTNGRQIDQINLRQEKYISATDGYCWKLSVGKNNQMRLASFNLKNNAQSQIIMEGVSELSDCEVLFGENGTPLLATLCRNRRVTVPLCNSAKRPIERLNRELGKSDWHIVDSTQDRKVWLVCASDPRKPNKYYLYDTENGNKKQVATSINSLEKTNLPTTKWVKIPTRDGSSIRGYLTKNYSDKSPLVIMVHSGKRYNWEFYPLVQLLANRGYSTLCINYRTNSDEMVGAEFTRGTMDILDSANYALKNKITSAGNISIIASKKGASHAVPAFLKNPKLFTSCILLSPIFPSGNNPLLNKKTLNEIRKPLIVISNAQNARNAYSSSAGLGSLFSYILCKEAKHNNLTAGLIETSLAKAHKNPKYEKISAKDLGEAIPLFDGFGLIKNNWTEFNPEEENESNYDML
ncbi:MAG: hypothetical protein LBF54_00895 [Holosporaceae bacterium]|nr:hypothetical protein [Holosporaceae bacterium]